MLFISSCADLDLKSDFLPEKPTDVAESEYLNSFDVLKSYINVNDYPIFKLGVKMSVDEFISKGTKSSLALANFMEVTPVNAMVHASVVKEDGDMDFNAIQNLVGTAKDVGLLLHGHNLCWYAQQNKTYLDGLIADIVLPTETTSGFDIVADFEFDDLGSIYPMTGNSSAVVEEDPKGVSGKVLRVGNTETPATYSFPKIKISLPDGRKLGNYTKVFVDFYGTGATGLYGGGMRMGINDRPMTDYTAKSPASFGCPDGAWGRGMIALDISELNLSDAEKELTSFTLSIGSGTGSGNYLIDNVSMFWEITSGSIVGNTLISDFDTNDLGDVYSMMGSGSATVVVDPSGEKNQVLNVISNQSYPEFPVSLPPNTTLGDCNKISLRFYGTGTTGRYGSGMKLSINGSSLFQFGSPNDFGCEDNKWGVINLDLSKEKLTSEQKSLTNFTVAVGSATGSGDYYIDDVAIHWVLESIIVKTPEEKEEILTKELEKYIVGVMEASDGYIKSWDVINEPMSDNDSYMLRSAENESNVDGNFYWADYLGENYARTVIAYARQSFMENNGTNELKLFINESGLEKNESNKCDRLLKMIDEWEKDGVTVIDGIGVDLKLSYNYSDPILQEQNNKNLVDLFQKLAATGKLIRISDLSIEIIDNDGVVNSNNLTLSHLQRISLYYEYIIDKYFEIIPNEQCYGITLGSPVDTKTFIGLWNNKYNRNYTYAGFIDGLSGK